LLSNILYIPLSDANLTSWVAIEIFKRTVCTDDESNQHVLYSYESEHPYPADTTMLGKIYIPGAIALRITFDSKCRTGSDTLAFYKDEELSNELKIFS
jgi:hypothetical protein